jgi:hypothetical protein
MSGNGVNNYGYGYGNYGVQPYGQPGTSQQPNQFGINAGTSSPQVDTFTAKEFWKSPMGQWTTGAVNQPVNSVTADMPAFLSKVQKDDVTFKAQQDASQRVNFADNNSIKQEMLRVVGDDGELQGLVNKLTDPATLDTDRPQLETELQSKLQAKLKAKGVPVEEADKMAKQMGALNALWKLNQTAGNVQGNPQIDNARQQLVQQYYDSYK